MESKPYHEKLKEEERAFENICKRCGACCGAFDDPCANLMKLDNGTYTCRDYKNRLGPQITVSGNMFTCVSIREHIKAGSLRPCCAYRNIKGGKIPHV
jgi:uncharacterized cysteine cluster protein YcgN (CxxCxxCC family)